MQITSLQCTKELGPKMLLSDGVTCTLSLPCSEVQEFDKQRICVSESDEPRDQCPARDEFISRKLGMSILDYQHVPFIWSSKFSSISANYQICGKV